MDDTPQNVPLITMYTKILIHLALHSRISQETLARQLGVTLRTVQRHLSELEGAGYVRVDRSTKPFEYQVDWSKYWEGTDPFRLILLHPEVIGALEAISAVALAAWEEAVAQGRDPGEALRAIFARSQEFLAPA